MTLEQLRIFVAVAEREHLTRAAAALRLTPSAVSAAVHALETRYGVVLFHRVGRRIELSETGRVFLIEAKATLASARTAELALSELAGLKRGMLTIQASQTIASYWLPPFLVAFKVAYPAIDVVLREDNSAGVTQAVLAGTADLGFLEGDIDAPALLVVTVAHDRLVIVAALDHPLAKRRQVKPQDLANASWILREVGSGTRAMFETAMRAQSIDPTMLTVTLELPTNEAVCAAARAGPHLTVVSELVARPHLDARRLTLIPLDLDTRAFSLIRHKERYRTKAAQAFEAMLPDFRDAWSGGGI
ncbi:LysR family transcriptional regulator [Beijerinckia sp. L45]|uniref:LysR family transcriptional regulator n=1 Tax=Beijerinckia sp. L45 TaxID=1641855 RepID=UPI00131DC2E8|nr:LysR family transcriptional regulator [Beijerinckia sp. L45]